jgi:putative transposase
LVFIDETWTKTNMATLRGWALRGARLTAKVPHGHWKTTTFLAALRRDRIDAPWVLDGPIDGNSFQIYVEKVLLPTLKPGDWTTSVATKAKSCGHSSAQLAPNSSFCRNIRPT